MIDEARREIEIDGVAVPFTVRVSTRAHRARIIVGPMHPLEVVVPKGQGVRAAVDLLEQKRGWVETKLRWVRSAGLEDPKLGLDRPGLAWLDGVPIRITHRQASRPSARLSDGILVVAGPREAATDAIQRWYRREARVRLGAETEAEAARLGARRPGTISVRDQKTRWGSCSSRGTLSYSWRLAMLPPEIRQYVVTHEVCHLLVHDHSRKFWDLLAKARPGWKQEADWLKEHGAEIGAYQPTMV